MTNEMADAVEVPAMDPSGMHLFCHEPVPWAVLSLAALWIVLGLIVVWVAVAGIRRRREGEPTASLSRRVTIASTAVLFLGSAIILWRWAGLIAETMYIAGPPLDSYQEWHLLYEAWTSLRLSGANLVLSGAGIVLGMILKKTPKGD